jgi:hypothetical protein
MELEKQAHSDCPRILVKLDDWGTIERKENRATVDQISSKSLPRISNDRFRSSIVIVLELVLDLCCRQTGGRI